ncbi:Fe-S cluster assembly protein SufB [Candidatus Woesebacteria bacterium]|nr:Fe-S cluster assembly protein SufB [Candidatus Woesebacteria bacterium]
MSRFAQKKTSDFESTEIDSYEYGFSYSTDTYAHIIKPGLNEHVVKEISAIKNEPEWMLKLRLEAYKAFIAKPTPNWGGDLSEINYDAIRYYLRPTDQAGKTWDDVPPEVKATFDKLGIPKAEREVLAGVKAQYDSEVIYGSLQNVWAKDGVIFLSMDEGLAQYPDLVKEYFNRVIPFGDNKFSALNTATWSGGSFVYIPKGVHVQMPLQTYFRINAPNAGQFERTLIIVDEGASVHYIEGCFTAGTSIVTNQGLVAIEDVSTSMQVLTHTGKYKPVYHTQVRPYTGELFTLTVTGQPSEKIEATEEHPFFVVKRKRKKERNTSWEAKWIPVKELQKGDYVCTPIDKTHSIQDSIVYEVPVGNGRRGWQLEKINIPCTADLFKLIGYYLAEGSISGGSYLNFSFNVTEREYIEEVKELVFSVFGENRISEAHHEKNHGTNVVVSSVRLCRFFEQFGTHSNDKQIPDWVMHEDVKKQASLISCWYRGDGNYYSKTLKHGFKEMFRISSVSKTLALQGRMVLARLGIASSLNQRDRRFEKRQTMYNLVIGGEYMIEFGKIVEFPVQPKIWGKKRATAYFVDNDYLYAPIKSIENREVDNISVYNFSVRDDESYVAGGVAVHNCTAPSFSTGSLHAAVVEIYVKKGARCQYTTVQNWYKNIYNLVTKRAYVEEEGEMVWTDFNMGSKLTMKYPGFVLAGKGAKGEALSMAMAGSGQHQDTGSKAIHLAPYTSSTIIAKSISKGSGRTSYRGLINIGPNAHHSKNTVICDALLLDALSRSDTYPVDKIFNKQVEVSHEASVSKIGDDQLFYLMSRGVSEEQARKLIVNGFIDDLVRKLPLEYAVEMNRLIDHEMEGSIG